MPMVHGQCADNSLEGEIKADPGIRSFLGNSSGWEPADTRFAAAPLTGGGGGGGAGGGVMGGGSWPAATAGRGRGAGHPSFAACRQISMEDEYEATAQGQTPVCAPPMIPRVGRKQTVQAVRATGGL